MAPEDVLAALDKPQEAPQPHEAVSTGSLGLDLALGGGWPAHRISELYGDPMTGKSVVAYHAVANAQTHGVVVWVDSGSNFDPLTAVCAGVDLDKLLIFRPPDLRTAYEAIRACSSGEEKPTLAVLDTASGLEGSSVAGGTFALLIREIRNGGPAVLATNNRHVGEMTGWFSTAIRAARGAAVHLNRFDKDTVARVTKHPNHVVPSRHDIKFRVEWGRIDVHRELVTLGMDSGVLTKRGSWVYFGNYKLAQGTGYTAALLKEASAHAQAIRREIIKCLT